VVGRAHIRAAATGGILTVVVGVGAVVLLPLVLAVCSSPASESRSGPRSPEGQVAVIAKAPPAEVAATEAQQPSKVRRIEDLPPAAPVAVRPLRTDELPEAASPGRARRGKEGSTLAVSEQAAPPGGVAKGKVAGGALRIEDLPSVSAAVRPLRPEELNPELVRRADELLWEHPAPVGTDIPLEVNGKSYIARFALHYHEFGSAQKPWGYHKGVTLYSTEP
jgi:hypothetical protein